MVRRHTPGVSIRVIAAFDLAPKVVERRFGPANVANLGSREKFNYSAVGDNVNLAPRIEGVSKTYGLDILIAESTLRAVREFAVLLWRHSGEGKVGAGETLWPGGGPEVTQSPQGPAILRSIGIIVHACRVGGLDRAAGNLENTKSRAIGLNSMRCSSTYST